jgi:hypothetical protein
MALAILSTSMLIKIIIYIIFGGLGVLAFIFSA